MATREEAVQQWGHWVEQEIGGPAQRIEVAKQAASAAIDMGKNRNEIVRTARSAAADWDSQHQRAQHSHKELRGLGLTEKDIREQATRTLQPAAEFNVVLKEFGANKIKVIKVVREVTRSGLKDAKDLVETAPKHVLERVARASADAAATKLRHAGATVDVTYVSRESPLSTHDR